MKKLLLASAVAALSITAAQAAPTVYGKAYLTLDVQDGKVIKKGQDTLGNTTYVLSNADERTKLNSNASRIGVKGSEALTQNTDVIYQLEYRVDIDSDQARNWESRDTYLGLSNKQYGTLVAGRLSTIDDYVNYANVLTGSPIGGDNVLASFNAERANNAFAYFSPERNGLQFLGMYALDENNGTDTLDRDAYGVGVKYEPTNAPYKVGATYIQAGDDLKAARVTGAYAINPALTVGALYQNTDYDTDNNENAFALSANYKVAQTPWTAYGQLDLVDNFEGVEGVEKQRVVVGGKYAFNKATTGHLYGSFQNSEVGSAEDDAYGVGAGIEYKF